MRYIMMFFIIPVWMIFGMNEMDAQVSEQERDTTKAQENPPEALKKFVNEYKEQMKKDSSRQEENLMKSTGLNALVMDNTLSKSGHDFYEYFYEKWDPPETEHSFTIYINEKPSPGIGNLVEVKINYEKVFRSKLSPRQRAIKQIANQAVRKSANYLANYEKIKRQLEGEDMEGTGIY